jgi:transposase-like protein
MAEKLSAKEVYKRLKFKEQIQKKITTAQKAIKKAYQKLEDLQAACPHYDSEYRNKGNTGSWDREDTFWRDYECHDCGKRWQTDQAYENYKIYPYAKDMTYER